MIRTLFTFVLVLLPSLASAHTGVGDPNGFAHGFGHPLSGLDHILAMVAVGMFAAHLGGRALWLVPLSFVGMMAVSGAFGMAGGDVPLVEIGIGLSIVVLGLAVALNLNIPVIGAMGFVCLVAIFHGHAHGAEMPEDASGLAYGFGFVLATILLHGIGIGLGILIEHFGETYQRLFSRVAGGAMAAVGLAILGGAL
jgi:urease accessory protein